MKRNFEISIEVVALALVLVVRMAWAAEIHVRTVPTTEDQQDIHVTLAGYITPGDSKLLEHLIDTLLEDADPNLAPDYIDLSLDSPGGDFYEAMKIVGFVRSHKIATIIRQRAFCLSACAFIFMAGEDQQIGSDAAPDRSIEVGGRLGFHAPFLTQGKGSFNQAKDALRKLHMQLGSNLPAALFDDLLNKGPDEYVELKTIYDAIWLDIDLRGVMPEVPTDETLLNACVNEWRIHSQYEILNIQGYKNDIYGVHGLEAKDERGRLLRDFHGHPLSTAELGWPLIVAGPPDGEKRSSFEIRLSYADPVEEEYRPYITCKARSAGKGWLEVNGRVVPRWHAYALGRPINSLPKGPLGSMLRPFQGILPPISPDD